MPRDHLAEREATRYLLEEADTALGAARRQITAAQGQIRRLLANLAAETNDPEVEMQVAEMAGLLDPSMAEMAAKKDSET
jgi:hypothetical protein